MQADALFQHAGSIINITSNGAAEDTTAPATLPPALLWSFCGMCGITAALLLLPALRFSRSYYELCQGKSMAAVGHGKFIPRMSSWRKAVNHASFLLPILLLLLPVKVLFANFLVCL